MMEQIAIHDAAAHFDELVQRVQQTGQAITVTDHGKPVVDIVPTAAPSNGRLSRSDAFEAAASLWEELPPITSAQVRDLIDEGRL